MTESSAFDRFRFSFFEDTDSARQGLDIVALAALEGEERGRAEDMLLRYLPDSRAIVGLGVLRAPQAEPALVRLFDTEKRAQDEAQRAAGSDWQPYLLLYLAKALWQIRPDPRWPAAAIGVLACSDAIARQSAAEALYGIRDPAAAAALIKALDDAETLVRYHAARGLLAIHLLTNPNLPVEALDPQHMAVRVMADDAVRREGGKRDILAAIAGRPIRAP
jgi:hypothetical protein